MCAVMAGLWEGPGNFSFQILLRFWNKKLEGGIHGQSMTHCDIIIVSFFFLVSAAFHFEQI